MRHPHVLSKIIHLDGQQGEQCAGGCSLVTPKGIRGENRTLLGHIPSLPPPPSHSHFTVSDPLQECARVCTYFLIIGGIVRR